MLIASRIKFLKKISCIYIKLKKMDDVAINIMPTVVIPIVLIKVHIYPNKSN